LFACVSLFPWSSPVFFQFIFTPHNLERLHASTKAAPALRGASAGWRPRMTTPFLPTFALGLWPVHLPANQSFQSGIVRRKELGEQHPRRLIHGREFLRL